MVVISIVMVTLSHRGFFPSPKKNHYPSAEWGHLGLRLRCQDSEVLPFGLERKPGTRPATLTGGWVVGPVGFHRLVGGDMVYAHHCYMSFSMFFLFYDVANQCSMNRFDFVCLIDPLKLYSLGIRLYFSRFFGDEKKPFVSMSYINQYTLL